MKWRAFIIKYYDYDKFEEVKFSSYLGYNFHFEKYPRHFIDYTNRSSIEDTIQASCFIIGVFFGNTSINNFEDLTIFAFNIGNLK